MASKVNTSFTNSKTDIKRMAFRGQCTHALPGLPNHLKTTFQTDPQVSLLIVFSPQETGTKFTSASA